MSKRKGKIVLFSALCACIFSNAVTGCLRYGESRQDQDCQGFLEEVKERLQNTARGTTNQAGLYEDVKALSVKKSVEANHIPPKSCTEDVELYSNRDNYVALSTAYDVHRNAGTTRSQDVRNAITEHLENENIVGALKLQICEDYIDTGSFEDYKTGLKDVMKILACLYRNDGEPILSKEEYDEIILYLTGEIPNTAPISPICNEF